MFLVLLVSPSAGCVASAGNNTKIFLHAGGSAIRQSSFLLLALGRWTVSAPDTTAFKPLQTLCFEQQLEGKKLQDLRRRSYSSSFVGIPHFQI